jgi:hypothetical protein
VSSPVRFTMLRHHNASKARLKIFSQPLRVASGAIVLPRESQPYLPDKACMTRDAGIATHPLQKQSMNPPLMSQ